MTTATEPKHKDLKLVAHAEGPTSGAVGLPAQAVVPAHLLDGGEVIHFAIKPSPWFVVIVSLRWLAVAVFLGVLASREFFPHAYLWYVYQLAVLVAGARLVWAILEWATRTYVLTNHRVMRIRGGAGRHGPSRSSRLEQEFIPLRLQRIAVALVGRGHDRSHEVQLQSGQITPAHGLIEVRILLRVELFELGTVVVRRPLVGVSAGIEI